MSARSGTGPGSAGSNPGARPGSPPPTPRRQALTAAAIARSGRGRRPAAPPRPSWRCSCTDPRRSVRRSGPGPGWVPGSPGNSTRPPAAPASAGAGGTRPTLTATVPRMLNKKGGSNAVHPFGHRVVRREVRRQDRLDHVEPDPVARLDDPRGEAPCAGRKPKCCSFARPTTARPMKIRLSPANGTFSHHTRRAAGPNQRPGPPPKPSERIDVQDQEHHRQGHRHRLGQQRRQRRGRTRPPASPGAARPLRERAEIGQDRQHREQGAGQIRLARSPGHDLGPQRMDGEQRHRQAGAEREDPGPSRSAPGSATRQQRDGQHEQDDGIDGIEDQAGEVVPPGLEAPERRIRPPGSSRPGAGRRRAESWSRPSRSGTSPGHGRRGFRGSSCRHPR